MVRNSSALMKKSPHCVQYDDEFWSEFCCGILPTHHPDATHPNDPDYRVKLDLFKLPLYPHQWYGSCWMFKQEFSGWNGGILGDVPGLGKVLYKRSIVRDVLID